MHDVVVVGAATRDVTPDEPRGWRLGGGVAYGALLLARLGLRVAAIVGLDRVALDGGEPELLREAGVDVRPVVLARGPVFENHESPAGRVQRCLSASESIPVSVLPPDCRDARAYLLAPVAGELGEAWATEVPATAIVGLAWQGLLRDLVPGMRTRTLAPRLSPLLARADVVGVSRDDLGHEGRALVASETIALEAMLAPGHGLAVTAGRAGGLWLWRTGEGRIAARRWPAVPAGVEIDPVGAGDVFLAAMLAGMLATRRVEAPAWPEAPRSHARWLRWAATAGALAAEGAGLAAVPDLAAIRARLRAPADQQVGG